MACLHLIFNHSKRGRSVSFKFYWTIFQNSVTLHVPLCQHLSCSPSVCPSVRPFVRSSICLSACPSVCLSVRLFVRLSVRPFVRSSVCQFVRPSVCPSVHSFVHQSVGPSVRSFVLSPFLPLEHAGSFPRVSASTLPFLKSVDGLYARCFKQ